MKALKYKEIDSTQDEAKRLIQRGERDFYVISDTQSSGRGTQGRHWVSNSDSGLYFSLVIPLGRNLYENHDLTEYCQKITETAVLSLRMLLIDYCLEPALNELYVKPINDLYYDSKKLAGILVEHLLYKEESFLIIGIGLNIKLVDSDGSFDPISLEEMCDSSLELDKDEFSRLLARNLVNDLNG